MFNTDDIDLVYKNFIENNIECLSGPQYFDFTAQGFGIKDRLIRCKMLLFIKIDCRRKGKR